MKKNGYTILEIIISLSIFIIVMFTGLPSFLSLSSSYQKSSVKEQFITDIIRAQNASIQQGCRGILKNKIENGIHLLEFGCDYLDYNLDEAIADSDSAAISKCPIFKSFYPKNFIINIDAPILINSRGLVINPDSSNSNRTFNIKFLKINEDTIATGKILTTGVVSYE